jgi:hypothetical protein
VSSRDDGAGDLGELFVNREKVEMYVCEACGHLEFFLPD